MCGRARCTLNPVQIAGACGFNHGSASTIQTQQLDRYRPSYNVSPGAYMPVFVASEKEAPVIHCMKWGLIPGFTNKAEKPDHYRMFNARSESIKEKASFRRLISSKRCLVAVEGFFEWKKDGSRKQPYYIHFKEDDRPLVLAALYDSWANSEGEVLHTFTILTTRSSSSLEWLHDRMPVIFGNKDSIDLWLNNCSKFETILCPYEAPDLVWYPVTPAMGKPSFGGPECIKQIQLKSDTERPLSKFFAKKIDDKSQPMIKTKEQRCDDIYSKTEGLSTIKKETAEEPDTCGAKRELEATATNHRTISEGPPRKKGGSLRSGNDRQASLFSYFGRN